MNRFYADGGIVGGMDEGMLPPEAEGTGLPMEQLQSIPPEELQAIVMGAKEALEGTHPDPMNALEDFIEVFGEQELESLKEAVIQEIDGGAPVMEGDPSLMSDGLSDSIPTSIDGVEPAALSEGEYVIPADAVSGLGNGDTDSGARRLEDMVGKIRSARGSAPVSPPAMDPESVMPPEGGGYKRGGLVKGFLEDLEEMEGYAGGGPVKSFKYAEGGVVAPSLSSGLLALSQNSSPVNVMDSYPGGSFEVPAFVPPSESQGLVKNDFEFRATETPAERAARRIAEREARQAARLARPQARRDLRNERRLERQARPVARREQRRENAQARFDSRHQRSLDRIKHRQELEAARNGFAEGGAVPAGSSPSYSSGFLDLARAGLGSPGLGLGPVPGAYGGAPSVRADLVNSFEAGRFQPPAPSSKSVFSNPDYYKSTRERASEDLSAWESKWGLEPGTIPYAGKIPTDRFLPVGRFPGFRMSSGEVMPREASRQMKAEYRNLFGVGDEAFDDFRKN